LSFFRARAAALEESTGGRGECSNIPQHFVIFNGKVLATTEPAALLMGRPVPALCNFSRRPPGGWLPGERWASRRPQHFVIYINGKIFDENILVSELLKRTIIFQLFWSPFLPAQK
jgi:hypothetical protein